MCVHDVHIGFGGRVSIDGTDGNNERSTGSLLVSDTLLPLLPTEKISQAKLSAYRDSRLVIPGCLVSIGVRIG